MAKEKITYQLTPLTLCGGNQGTSSHGSPATLRSEQPDYSLHELYPILESSTRTHKEDPLFCHAKTPLACNDTGVTKGEAPQGRSRQLQVRRGGPTQVGGAQNLAEQEKELGSKGENARR